MFSSANICMFYIKQLYHKQTKHSLNILQNEVSKTTAENFVSKINIFHFVSILFLLSTNSINMKFGKKKK